MDVDIETITSDPHAVANALRGYLEEKPRSVFHPFLEFIAVNSNLHLVLIAALDTFEEKINVLKHLISNLPVEERVQAEMLLLLLHLLDDHSSKNQLPLRKSLPLFRPLFLRPSVEDGQSEVSDAQAAISVVRFCLDNRTVIFPH